jgi:co-chaperonin GroES (HSP10)
MIQAVSGYVVIKEIVKEKEETTKSGLYIAATEIDRSVPRGVVMSKGPNVSENIPLGATVAYAPHSGVDFEEGTEQYQIIVQEAIYGVVDNG